MSRTALFKVSLLNYWLSGQLFSLVEGGVDVFKMYTLCRQQLMYASSELQGQLPLEGSE